MSHAGPVTVAATTLHTVSPPRGASLMHSSPLPRFCLLSPGPADMISCSHEEDEGHPATACSAADFPSAVDMGMLWHCDYFN